MEKVDQLANLKNFEQKLIDELRLQLERCCISGPLSGGFLERHNLQFKAFAEDFKVSERLRFEPSGSGEFVVLKVHRSGCDHISTLNHLAKYAQIPVQLVSAAGQKDTSAEVVQFFSIPKRSGMKLETGQVNQRLKVVDIAEHHRALKIGDIESNFFEVCLRHSGSTLSGEVPAEQAFVNYYGEQRFSGRALRDLPYALRALLEQSPTRKNAKWRVSVLQSALFNLYCSQLSDLPDSAAMFGYAVETTDEENEFLKKCDLEKKLFKAYGKWGKGTRRKTTAVAKNLTLESDRSIHKLSFELPSGSYATVFLREFLTKEGME